MFPFGTPGIRVLDLLPYVRAGDQKTEELKMTGCFILAFQWDGGRDDLGELEENLESEELGVWKGTSAEAPISVGRCLKLYLPLWGLCLMRKMVPNIRLSSL